jgi:hypothetical protein
MRRPASRKNGTPEPRRIGCTLRPTSSITPAANSGLRQLAASHDADALPACS